jgi:hypothetical protein
MPGSIDDHVGGVQPLPYRLAETLRQCSLVPGAYRDGATAGEIQADDTQLQILMPQGCLSFNRKPTLIGLLQFRQGEQPFEHMSGQYKPAEWFLSVYGKSNWKVLSAVSAALEQKYKVAIKPVVLSGKQ